MSLTSVAKRLWEDWNIRGCMLLSLLLQVFLIFSAPFRKRCRSKPLNGLIWLAYLLWDWLDTSAIGLIFRNIGDASKPKDGSEDFMALWASFLLMHLGGPDAITSFAIQDNGFWLRHLTVLVFQVLTTAYIFYLYFPQSKMWIPTAMVFLAGTIKCLERVRALYLASLDRVGPLQRRKAYHGLDYRDAVRVHKSTSSIDVLEPLGSKRTDVEYPEDSKDPSRKKDWESPINLLQDASRFFETFKGFITGTLFSSVHRDWSRRYFLHRNSNLAFRLIEYELSFMYDLFHTKVVVLRSLWCIARVVSFSLILGATITFISIEKQHEFHNKFDVKISFSLLMGATGLEIINALMLLLSDGTVIALEGKWSILIPRFILRRWSRSYSQHNMIRYCFKGPPTCLRRSAALVGLAETLDQIYIWAFSSSTMVEEHLENFIFEQLKEKSDKAKNLQDAKETCSQRGGKALENYSNLKWSIDGYEYGESLLLWHVTTEIYYQTLSLRGQEEYKICKELSDYLFYLFVMQSTMMGAGSASWERALQDTCAEAKRFFSQKELKGLNLEEACQKIIDEDTPFRPDTVKGSNCKSVLFDASILAKQLKNLGNHE